MQALSNFLIIKCDNTKPNKGLIMGTESLVEGTIVSVGKDIADKFGEGWLVLFDKNKTMQYSIGGQNLYFIKGETVFAKL